MKVFAPYFFYYFDKMINKLMTKVAISVFFKICATKSRQKPEKIFVKELTFTKVAGLMLATQPKIYTAKSLLLVGFEEFTNSHFQEARFGSCFHYGLLLVNIIQKRF